MTDKYEGIEEEFLPRPWFQKWAKENGVDMTNEEEWKPWWDCWCNGYNKGIADIREIL